jgi:hypothetical protein
MNRFIPSDWPRLVQRGLFYALVAALSMLGMCVGVHRSGAQTPEPPPWIWQRAQYPPRAAEVSVPVAEYAVMRADLDAMAAEIPALRAELASLRDGRPAWVRSFAACAGRHGLPALAGCLAWDSPECADGLIDMNDFGYWQRSQGLR